MFAFYCTANVFVGVNSIFLSKSVWRFNQRRRRSKLYCYIYGVLMLLRKEVALIYLA